MNINEYEKNILSEEIDDLKFLLKFVAFYKSQNMLNENDIKIYLKYKFIYEFFGYVANNKLKQYYFLFKYFFINKYQLEINEFVDTPYYKDLQIIDNLHDFCDARVFKNKDKDEKSLNILNSIRLLISDLLSDNTKKLVLNKNNIPKNVNDDKFANKIFNYYNYSNLIKCNGKIDVFKKNKNNIYYETPGIFQVNDTLCPYKKAIDEAKANCDSNDIRKLNKTLTLSNYNNNEILIKLYDENIYFNTSNDMNFYKDFFEKNDENNIANIKIEKKIIY